MDAQRITGAGTPEAPRGPRRRICGAGVDWPTRARTRGQAHAARAAIGNRLGGRHRCARRRERRTSAGDHRVLTPRKLGQSAMGPPRADAASARGGASRAPGTPPQVVRPHRTFPVSLPSRSPRVAPPHPARTSRRSGTGPRTTAGAWRRVRRRTGRPPGPRGGDRRRCQRSGHRKPIDARMPAPRCGHHIRPGGGACRASRG